MAPIDLEMNAAELAAARAACRSFTPAHLERLRAAGKYIFNHQKNQSFFHAAARIHWRTGDETPDNLVDFELDLAALFAMEYKGETIIADLFTGDAYELLTSDAAMRVFATVCFDIYHVDRSKRESSTFISTEIRQLTDFFGILDKADKGLRAWADERVRSCFTSQVSGSGKRKASEAINDDLSKRLRSSSIIPSVEQQHNRSSPPKTIKQEPEDELEERRLSINDDASAAATNVASFNDTASPGSASNIPVHDTIGTDTIAAASGDALFGSVAPEAAITAGLEHRDSPPGSYRLRTADIDPNLSPADAGKIGQPQQADQAEQAEHIEQAEHANYDEYNDEDQAPNWSDSEDDGLNYIRFPVSPERSVSSASGFSRSVSPGPDLEHGATPRFSSRRAATPFPDDVVDDDEEESDEGLEDLAGMARDEENIFRPSIEQAGLLEAMAPAERNSSSEEEEDDD